MNNVRHSSSQPKWGTPPEVVAIGQAVLTVPGLGMQITVDPYTETEFNEHVRASVILDGSKGSDGYRDRWLPIDTCPRADWLLAGGESAWNSFIVRPVNGIHLATGFVNAPGNEDGSNIKNAWRLLDRYRKLGWLAGGGFWVAFNLNQFQTLQDISETNPLSAEYTGCRCVPDRRLAFASHSSRPPTRLNKHGEVVENDDQPSHPCFFMLLPSLDERIAADQMRIFESMASSLGEVF